MTKKKWVGVILRMSRNQNAGSNSPPRQPCVKPRRSSTVRSSSLGQVSMAHLYVQGQARTRQNISENDIDNHQAGLGPERSLTRGRKIFLPDEFTVQSTQQQVAVKGISTRTYPLTQRPANAETPAHYTLQDFINRSRAQRQTLPRYQREGQPQQQQQPCPQDEQGRDKDERRQGVQSQGRLGRRHTPAASSSDLQRNRQRQGQGQTPTSRYQEQREQQQEDICRPTPSAILTYIEQNVSNFSIVSATTTGSLPSQSTERQTTSDRSTSLTDASECASSVHSWSVAHASSRSQSADAFSGQAQAMPQRPGCPPDSNRYGRQTPTPTPTPNRGTRRTIVRGSNSRTVINAIQASRINCEGNNMMQAPNAVNIPIVITTATPTCPGGQRQEAMRPMGHLMPPDTQQGKPRSTPLYACLDNRAPITQRPRAYSSPAEEPQTAARPLAYSTPEDRSQGAPGPMAYSTPTEIQQAVVPHSAQRPIQEMSPYQPDLACPELYNQSPCTPPSRQQALPCPSSSAQLQSQTFGVPNQTTPQPGQDIRQQRQQNERSLCPSSPPQMQMYPVQCPKMPSATPQRQDSAPPCPQQSTPPPPCQQISPFPSPPCLPPFPSKSPQTPPAPSSRRRQQAAASAGTSKRTNVLGSDEQPCTSRQATIQTISRQNQPQQRALQQQPADPCLINPDAANDSISTNANVFRTLVQKLSSTFDYISQLMSPNRYQAAAGLCQPSQGPDVAASAGCMQAGASSSANANCTSSMKSYGVHNLYAQNQENVSDSLRDCANAKKCGRVKFDKIDKCTGEAKVSPIYEQQVDSLVKDSYCPGIMQETINGEEDFNSAAFKIALGYNPTNLNDVGCLPEVEPLSLIEAFGLRIQMEREACSRFAGPNASPANPLMEIQNYFTEIKHNPSPLNRSIYHLLTAEAIIDKEQKEESKQISFEADVQKVVTGFPDKPNIKIIGYTGTTKVITV